MQEEPPAAGKPSGYTGLFTDACWWRFCLLILTLKFSLLALDPLPKFYMGDSGSYIWTALSGWIPPDRSFAYGYVIRWSSVWTESLNSLVVLQVFVGAGTALVFASTCRLIFQLSPRLSYVFGILCSVDPLQLLWEHYVMTETISLFLYVVMLRYSFLYLRDRRVRDLVLVQVLAVVLLSFRLSYLILVQVSTVILPIMAYLPLAYARFRGDSKAVPRASIIKQFSYHLLISVLLMLLLHRGYKEINGALSHREPDYGYNTGLHLLAVWAPALKPEDAVDPRLAQVIAQGGEYHIEELVLRNNQRFTPGFLVDRWRKLEGDAQKANEIGKQTAMRALQRNPLNILTLGLKTYLAFWDIRSWRKWAKLDLGHALNERQMSVLANRFHYAADPLSRKQRPTILQSYFLKSYPYCLLVMAAPALSGVSLLLRRTRSYCALVFVHASITLAVVTIFTPNPSLRYVQPVSLLTLLIFAVYAKALSDRWSIHAALIPGDLRKKEAA
jgi:hypothetical protein